MKHNSIMTSNTAKDIYLGVLVVAVPTLLCLVLGHIAWSFGL